MRWVSEGWGSLRANCTFQNDKDMQNDTQRERGIEGREKERERKGREREARKRGEREGEGKKSNR